MGRGGCHHNVEVEDLWPDLWPDLLTACASFDVKRLSGSTKGVDRVIFVADPIAYGFEEFTLIC